MVHLNPTKKLNCDKLNNYSSRFSHILNDLLDMIGKYIEVAPFCNGSKVPSHVTNSELTVSSLVICTH